MSSINELFSLKEKKIVVAGGAGQIGFSMVSALVEFGAKVVIADLDYEMAQRKVRDEGLNNENIHIYKLDVSDYDSIKKFSDELNFERIHGLINCFHFKGNTRKLDSESNFFASFENYPEEAWDMVHDVNLKGTFLISQLLIDKLKFNKSSIVNVSSTYGMVSADKSIYGESGINSPVAYASSKGAIINLTRYMATHLCDYDIRVNCLSPGGVYNNQSEEFVKNYCQKTPMKRMASASDYQGAIIFLLSEASNYMTGANLVIDGGWTAW